MDKCGKSPSRLKSTVNLKLDIEKAQFRHGKNDVVETPLSRGTFVPAAADAPAQTTGNITDF